MTQIMSVPTRVADLNRWRKILPHPARTTAVQCVVRLRCETCVRTNEQNCQRFVNLRKLVMIIARSSKSTQIGSSSLLRGWFGVKLPAKRTSPIARSGRFNARASAGMSEVSMRLHLSAHLCAVRCRARVSGRGPQEFI